MVERNATVFDEKGVPVHLPKPVPLAKCEVCKSRPRALPVEFLPRKIYSLPVIEDCCNRYRESPYGLRKTMKDMGGDAPHPSTLHGWIEGMGERVLDRIEPEVYRKKLSVSEPLAPVSAVVAETAKREDPGLLREWSKPQEIPREKYRSEFRRERLEAVIRLIFFSHWLFPGSRYPLTEWQAYLSRIFHVAQWTFLSRSPVTAIQRKNTGFSGYPPFREDFYPCKGGIPP